MKQHLTIAVLFEFPTAHGGEHSMVGIMRELSRDINFLAIRPSGGELERLLNDSNIQQIGLSFRDETGSRLADQDIVQRLCEILDDHQIDHLHANSLSLSRFLARHQSRWKCSISGHIRDMMNLKRSVVQQLSQIPLVAVSEATSRHYVQQGIDASQLQVIHNGIDAESLLNGMKYTTSIRVELGLTEDQLLAIMVGQICLRKGHDQFVEMLTLLDKSNDQWHFLIVGERYSLKNESLEFERRLHQRISEIGFSERVHFLGYRSDAISLIHQSDLLIHTAKQEPFGRVLLEASALGTPILATDVGGTKEMLEADREALLVPASHPQMMAEQCQRLMHNSKERIELGRHALQKVRNQFTISKAAHQQSEFWYRIINDSEQMTNNSEIP